MRLTVLVQLVLTSDRNHSNIFRNLLSEFGISWCCCLLVDGLNSSMTIVIYYLGQ